MEYVEETVKVHEEIAEKKLLDALAVLLGSQRFDLWFGSETTIRIDRDEKDDQESNVVFGVKNRFAADWIRNNFGKELDQACVQVFGKPLSTCFAVRKVGHSANPGRRRSSRDNDTDDPDGHDLNGNVAGTTVPSPHCLASASVIPSLAPLQSPLYSVVAVPEDPPEIPVEKDIRRLFAASAPPRPAGRRFASLKTFVEGLSNRLACRAVDLAVHHPGQINPVYLYGPTSVGKTHLLEGIWSEVRRRPDRKPPLYMTTEQFVSAFMGSIQPGTSRSGIVGFRNRFKDISILLIDDIQYLYRKDATQAEFLYTIDTLRNQGVQIVLTGDRPLKELTGLKREILCRLEAGIVCGIEQPERETSLKIFQNMVKQRRLPIGPDVCRMVASQLGTHARQLCGALNRLHAVYLSSGEPISLPVAEETLADLVRSNRRNVRLQDIDKAVCETFGLSEESLKSKSRTKQIATPRMLAMWLARKYTRSALSEIGKYFGDRSHSTVITAQKKVDAWVDADHPIHAETFDMPISEAIGKIERILQSG